MSGEDLTLINALARKELSADEVYTFTVRLCDNEIDREGERFPRETLEALAEMFVGKSGIFDHQWSARGQTARIYKTEVVDEPGQRTRAGDGACYLKGWAYLLRTEGNRELIDEIEGGIKREVSVGCAVEKAVCSVCGKELGRCSHVKGRTYDGKLCWAELTGARDAYEWSFVAVPAQRKAGVMKGLSPSFQDLTPEQTEALKALEKEAEMGRRYLEGLRGEVVRMWAAGTPELEMSVVRSIAAKLSEEELLAMKALFARKGKGAGVGTPQLSYPGERRERKAEDGAFMV